MQRTSRGVRCSGIVGFSDILVTWSTSPQLTWRKINEVTRSARVRIALVSHLLTRVYYGRHRDLDDFPRLILRPVMKSLELV